LIIGEHEALTSSTNNESLAETRRRLDHDTLPVIASFFLCFDGTRDSVVVGVIQLGFCR
jgi:hypothetical protein